MNRCWLSVFLFLFCVSACVKKDRAYFLQKGEELKAQLYEELHEVQELADLVTKQDRLKVLFDDTAELAIVAHRFVGFSERSEDVDELSQLLADEIHRVLMIPGARNIFEKCQEAALEKLLLIHSCIEK